MSQDELPILGDLGISENEERVWRALLRSPNADEESLAAESGLAVREARGALNQLAEHDLLSATESPSGFVALDPRLSIQAKIANEQRELADRAARLSALQSRLPRISGDYEIGRARVAESPGLTIVRGLGNLRAESGRANDRVQRQTRSMLTRSSASGSRDALRRDRALYERGIRCRTILRSDLIGDPEVYKVWAEASHSGDEFRSMPSVPMHMLIWDEDLAAVPVHQDETHLGAIFIRERTIVDMMVRVFDHFWIEAAPMFDNTEAAGTTSPRSKQVLKLLSTGAPDAAIARTLGVGVRTVRRDVAELRQTLGAHTRTEIVAAAIRQGWL